MGFNSTVLALSPLDFFRFPETSGTTATNLATVGRPGTYASNVTLNVTPGLIINESSTPGCSTPGGASDTGVSVANPAITGDFTIIAVLKAPRPSDGLFSCIFGSNAITGISRLAFSNSSGNIFAQFGTGTLTSTLLLPANQTVVITLVNDTIANKQTLYINASADTASVASTAGLPALTTYWGQYRNGGSDYKLNATLGAGVLFSSALTAAQVKSVVAAAIAEFSAPNDATLITKMLASSPVQAYVFDEIAGSLAQDFSPNAAHGTYVGAITQNVTPGIIVSDPTTPCISLPGGDGVTVQSNGVLCPSPGISANAPFTIMATLKMPSFINDTTETIYGSTTGSGFTVNRLYVYSTTGALQGKVLAEFGQSYVSNAAIPLNQVAHVAFVNDPANGVQRIYINGIQDSTIALPGTVNQLDSYYWGQFDASEQYKFLGNLAYCAVYPSALSAASILAIANDALAGAFTTSPSSLAFLNPSEPSQLINVSRTGYVGNFYASSGSNVSVSPSSFPNGTLSYFTITPLLSGTDSVVVTDDTGDSVTIPVTIGATGSLTVSNISAAFVPNGTFSVSESNYDGPFTVSVVEPTIAGFIAPGSTNGPGPITYEVIGASPGVTAFTVTDNHGGNVSFEVSIDFTTLPFPASVNFIDIYGNPLPPSLRVDFFQIETSPDSSNIVASDYLGVDSNANVTLIVGQAYRIEYTGFGAPPLPSFFTPTSTVATTIVPDRYISPWANRDGYAQFMAGELWPLNRSSLAARTHGGGVYLLFQTFASVLAQLDLFGRTNAAGERLVSSVDAQVDSWAKDFLGSTFIRLPQETNAAFIARIIAWINLDFGTLDAINYVVQQWFLENPDESSLIQVFDRQSDPARSSYYGLTAGQVAVIAYYPPPPQSLGFFIGQSFLGQDFLTDPYSFAESLLPFYSSLGVQVNRVKAAGIVPVYIASRGENPGGSGWGVPWSRLLWDGTGPVPTGWGSAWGDLLWDSP